MASPNTSRKRKRVLVDSDDEGEEDEGADIKRRTVIHIEDEEEIGDEDRHSDEEEIGDEERHSAADAKDDTTNAVELIYGDLSTSFASSDERDDILYVSTDEESFEFTLADELLSHIIVTGLDDFHKYKQWLFSDCLRWFLIQTVRYKKVIKEVSNGLDRISELDSIFSDLHPKWLTDCMQIYQKRGFCHLRDDNKYDNCNDGGEKKRDAPKAKKLKVKDGSASNTSEKSSTVATGGSKGEGGETTLSSSPPSSSSWSLFSELKQAMVQGIDVNVSYLADAVRLLHHGLRFAGKKKRPFWEEIFEIIKSSKSSKSSRKESSPEDKLTDEEFLKKNKTVCASDVGFVCLMIFKVWCQALDEGYFIDDDDDDDDDDDAVIQGYYRGIDASRSRISHRCSDPHVNSTKRRQREWFSEGLLLIILGYRDIVRILCDKKANLEATSSNYSAETALFCAANRYHVDTVALLLNAHADANTESYNGSLSGKRTSVLQEMVLRRLDLAEAKDQEDVESIIASLIRAGAEFHNREIKHSPLELMSRSSCSMITVATIAHKERLEDMRKIITDQTSLIDSASGTIISYLDLSAIITEAKEENKGKDKYDSIDLEDYVDEDEDLEEDEYEYEDSDDINTDDFSDDHDQD
eukprot:jgi/Bigna1/136389/aug1.33_g11097